MKRETLQEIRNDLLRRIGALQKAAANTISALRMTPPSPADTLDRAVAYSNIDTELSIRGRERDQLRELNEAVQRIDRGVFGMCEQCGKAIPERRLRTIPLSRLCTECQQRSERSLRNRRGNDGFRRVRFAGI